MSNYDRIPISFTRGEGCWLFTDADDRYLDFLSGVAVNCLGYAHPAITAALHQAALKPIHVSNYYEIPEQSAAAATLCRLAGEATADRHSYRAVFGNSGAEAIEAALKLSRKATGRSRLLTFGGAFHGRTYGALSITHKAQVQQGFSPLLPDCQMAAFNDAAALELIDAQTAAVIVECIQGEGGVVAADHDWLRAIAKKAGTVGALLVADEIQAGAGRTGKFFAFEHAGISPDIITLAKGIGGGVPVGVMLAKAEVAAAFGPGTHGSTFAGSPFICSVVNAVLQEISKPEFLDQVRRHSQYFFERLRQVAARYPDQISEIRGRGFLIGAEFVAAGGAKNAWNALRQRHVLCGLAGTNVLRILPPLIAGKAEIDVFLEALEEILKKSAAV